MTASFQDLCFLYIPECLSIFHRFPKRLGITALRTDDTLHINSKSFLKQGDITPKKFVSKSKTILLNSDRLKFNKCFISLNNKTDKLHQQQHVERLDKSLENNMDYQCLVSQQAYVAYVLSFNCADLTFEFSVSSQVTNANTATARYLGKFSKLAKKSQDLGLLFFSLKINFFRLAVFAVAGFFVECRYNISTLLLSYV